mgnify:FL=1
MRQTRVTQSTHAPLLRKPCISSDLLTPPKERLTNCCQMWQANTQGSRFSQLALCIQWLSRQTIKLRRENIVWVLKTCRGKRNVDLNGIHVYKMYRERIRDFTNTSTYPECRDNDCRLYFEHWV